MRVFILALIGTCFSGSLGGDVFLKTRHKRATCPPEFEKITTTHSACKDPSTQAIPNPFTPEEAAVIIQQHIDYRAQENASAMMRPVWDDDIAYVAQKWADVCGEQGAHDGSLERLVPSLMGIYIGQNVATFSGGFSTYEIATDLWHDEIQNFEYGTGAVPSNAVIGHYTQVVLADVSKIGCGRTTCGGSTKVVCNYAKGQMTPDLVTPFAQCEDPSCKFNCQTRDENQLCDCGGLMCLHQGTLDKTTCTCSCKPGFSGPSCETADCANIAADRSYCDPNFCWYQSAICTSLCGVCDAACDSVTCENGGTMNTFICKCTCPEGFTGDTCSIQETTTPATSTTPQTSTGTSTIFYTTYSTTPIPSTTPQTSTGTGTMYYTTYSTTPISSTTPQTSTGTGTMYYTTYSTTPIPSTTPQTSTGTGTMYYTTYSTTPIPSTTPQTSTGTGTMYYTTYSTTPIPSTTPQTSTGTGIMYYTTYSTTPIPSTTPQTSTGTGTMYYTTYSTTPIPSTTPQTSTGTGIMYYTTYSTTPIPSTTPQTSTGTGTMYYTTYSTTPIPSTTPQTSTGTGTMYYTTYSTTPIPSTTPQTSTGTGTMYYTTYSTTPIPSTTPQTSTGTGTMYYTTYSTTPIPSTTPQTSTGTGTIFYTTYSTTPIPSTTPQTSTGTGTMYYTTYSTTPIPSTTPQTSTGTGTMYYTTYSTSSTPSTTPQTSTQTTPISTTEATTSTTTSTTTTTTTTTPSTTAVSSCTTPPEIPNSDVTVADGVATYKCQEGTLPSGGSRSGDTSTCTDGVWSPTTLQCRDVSSCYKKSGRYAVYSGTQSTTNKGHTCQAWSSQSPIAHSKGAKDVHFATVSGYTENPSVAAQSNYCRDPYGFGKPFCFTMTPGVRIDYCNEVIPDCNTITTTATPTSTQTTTATSTTESTTPTTTSTTTTTTTMPSTTAVSSCTTAPEIPNSEVTVADGVATYKCQEGTLPSGGSRSGDTSTCTDGVWSPTTLQCLDVSSCYKKSGRYAVYSGTQSTTNKGHTCQAWSSQSPIAHSKGTKDVHFATVSGYTENPSVAAQSNYCRDPTGFGKPFCFTMTPGVRIDYCNEVIPDCNTITTTATPTSTQTTTATPTSTQTTTATSTTESTTPTTTSTTTTTTTTTTPSTTAASSCTAAPEIPNSEVTVADGVATYKCQEGTLPFGGTSSGDTSTCTDGVWSPTTLQCRDVSTCYQKSGRFAVYSGTQTTTNGGHTCQAWSSQSPVAHSQGTKDVHFATVSGYTENPTVAAQSNYCRDPSGYGKPFCFTMTPGKRIDYCDQVIPKCDCPEPPIVANSNVSRVDNKATYSCKEGFAATSATSSVSTCLNGLWSPVNIKCHDVSQCYIISGGSRIYTGTHSTTLSGHTCQAWAEQTPLAHSYEAKHFIRLAGPDTTLADHGNYCRDPSGYGRRSRGYLWCFTTDPSKRLEKCSDVPQCPL